MGSDRAEWIVAACVSQPVQQRRDESALDSLPQSTQRAHKARNQIEFTRLIDHYTH